MSPPYQKQSSPVHGIRRGQRTRAGKVGILRVPPRHCACLPKERAVSQKLRRCLRTCESNWPN
eukprot:2600668-Pleurochrysis_carterae.AAC.2